MSELENAISMVEAVLGVQVHLSSFNAKINARLSLAKTARNLQFFASSQKYNAALGRLLVMEKSGAGNQVQVALQKARLLFSAGYHEDASNALKALKEFLPNNPQILLFMIQNLVAFGRFSDAKMIGQELLELTRSMQNQDEAENFAFVSKRLLAFNDLEEVQNSNPNRQAVLGYSLWRLVHVRPVSKHCAIFEFVSEGTSEQRGEPQRIGRRGHTPWLRTWHVTILAEVGLNQEGPLHFVERLHSSFNLFRMEKWILSIYHQNLSDGFGLVKISLLASWFAFVDLAAAKNVAASFLL